MPVASCTKGFVLSILYSCSPVAILPALSATQAYVVYVPSHVNTGTVVDQPLQESVNAVVLYTATPVTRRLKLSPMVVLPVLLVLAHALPVSLNDNVGAVLSIVNACVYPLFVHHAWSVAVTFIFTFWLLISFGTVHL